MTNYYAFDVRRFRDAIDPAARPPSWRPIAGGVLDYLRKWQAAS